MKFTIDTATNGFILTTNPNDPYDEDYGRPRRGGPARLRKYVARTIQELQAIITLQFKQNEKDLKGKKKEA
jgi:hypothetical protein